MMPLPKNVKLLTLMWIGAYFVLVSVPLPAQQQVDPKFEHEVRDPMFASGQGDLVSIDEGHHNFHTKDGRYRPFAQVLQSDGYIVNSHRGPFTTESLSNVDILVIANALHSSNETSWRLPVLSAFEDSEIEAVVSFVEAGGGLFLIADHMPMPGAAAELAARFSIEFSNGFVFETGENNQPATSPTIFSKLENRIGDHPITRGRNKSESIVQVASFTGSAFPVTGDSTSLIRFGENTTMLLPTAAWEFDVNTSPVSIPGWSQGVAIEHGKGRVVIFGEAAMFTSQVNAKSAPFGLSHPQARDNQQLALNIAHWLSRAL